MTGFDGSKPDYRTSRQFMAARRFQNAMHRWTVFEGKDITGPMKAQGKAGTPDDAQRAASAWIRENGAVETAGQPRMTL